LAAAVVHATEDVDAVVVVLGAVEEPGEWHAGQLDELEGLKVEDHSVFCASAVIVTAEDHHFIVADERSSLRLNTQRELNHQNSPTIIGHIILLDRVYPPAPLIPTKHVDIAVLENHCRHGAPFLVEFGDTFPPVEVY